MTDELQLPWENTAELDPTGGLSPGQAYEMADALRAAGVPADQIEAALRADGIDPTPPPADTRTDEQREFDDTFGAPASRDAYRIDFNGRTPEGTDLAGIAEANAAAVDWLMKTGFPASVGPAVMERAIDVGQATAKMSEDERAWWKLEQASDFERMAGGAARAAELMAYVGVVLRRAPGGLTDVLQANGALEDAGVLMHLANQGERLAARGG